MSNKRLVFATLGTIGIAAIAFLAWATLVNVQDAQPFVVTATHVTRHTSGGTDHRIADAHVAGVAVGRASAPPAPATTAPKKPAATPSARPSASASPTASPSPTPSPSPTALASAKPTAKPKKKALVHTPNSATPLPDVALLPRKRARAATDGIAGAVPGAFARTTSAQPRPAVRPASPAPAPASTSNQVALAPAPTPVATPVYAPETVVEARVRSAAQPEFPSDPSFEGVHATSVVLVTIGPTGRLIKAEVEKSSGYRELDAAATRAARLSTYLPPLVDGRGATESYRMVYEFK